MGLAPHPWGGASVFFAALWLLIFDMAPAPNTDNKINCLLNLKKKKNYLVLKQFFIRFHFQEQLIKTHSALAPKPCLSETYVCKPEFVCTGDEADAEGDGRLREGARDRTRQRRGQTR